MKLGLTEKQYNHLLTLISETELEEQSEPPAAEPEKGTSDKQAGGQGYPEVGKWESGVTRGPGNQVGITKWADVVGSKLTRGKANPLKEQNFKVQQLINPLEPNKRYPKAGSDYFDSVDSENRRKIDILTGKTKLKKHIYKANDGDNLFMNLIKGEFSEALLDLREITFTPGGMATQTVIEVIFSETVIVPIAIESLNAAILLNDIDLYFEQGSRDPEAGYRILQDIMVYVTRGVFRHVGNKFKVWLQSPAGRKSMREIVSKLSSFVNLIKTSIEKIPNSGLKTYISSKVFRLDLLISIINKTANLGSLIPKKFRMAILLGLLTYMSADALDKLLGNKKGTTNLEMSKSDGPSDEYMVKIQEVSKPTVSEEEIKTADDLNIISKKKDLKNITIETIKLWREEYPCFSGLYEKNKFMVIATTDEMDIFKINGIEYYESGTGIFNSKTDQMFEC
jgi:hypothetical protein